MLDAPHQKVNILHDVTVIYFFFFSFFDLEYVSTDQHKRRSRIGDNILFQERLSAGSDAVRSEYTAVYFIISLKILEFILIRIY